MEIKKILIAGDSFSSVQLSGDKGWPILLSERYNVVNVSQPGIGEYKILKNIQSQNLDNFDLIIISHTSPYRMHCQQNPLYPLGHLYSKSDIIFADAEDKLASNPSAKMLCEYFQSIFDLEYYKFIHNCCCRQIDAITKNILTIHMTNFEWNDLYQFDSLINFYDLYLKNRGSYNHYNEHGNQVVLDRLIQTIKLGN